MFECFINDDLISRQAAIDAVSSVFAPTPTQKDMVEDCLEIIKKLPSVQPEQKRGEWEFCALSALLDS